MDPDRSKQAFRLFNAAIMLGRDERERFLREHCGEDPAVLNVVNSLLEAHDEADGFLESSDPTGTDTIETDQRSPSQIGPYRILQEVGEGGMGVVYEAEQTAPVRRRVALKLIKRGLDTRQVIARFEAERQALALMDHPGVARVLDAGSTVDGRPYFVMEYVAGVPITEHCDRQRLTTRERLELFMRVCDGVQHAHQKAIIHRDLKPSNVLVALRDGKPQPKIIDFGVAKATAQSLTEKTMVTGLGMLIGTPEYMSPEQAEMTGQAVDTRTDVYSLGVMLYQLLSGALPFEPTELREAGFEGIRKKIREGEPLRPSTRLSTLEGKRSAESARSRSVDLSTLRRQLAGDLDWIVMRALEKDPGRRYESPNELAKDLERYLTNQPVHASPPSVTYRTRKFVRRHSVGVVITAVTLLALLAVAVMMTIQAGRIARERDRANREAEARGQVSEFLQGLFKLSNPSEARGNRITARELLDLGAARIDESIDTETRADLMLTIGQVYRDLGLYESAETLFARALDARREALGADDPGTLGAMNNLALLYQDQGRYDRAESLLVECLATRRSSLGDAHPETLASMNNLAALYTNQGRFDEAEPLLREALEVRRRSLDEEHPDTLMSMNNLAILYARQDRAADAEHLFAENLAIQTRVLGLDHPETLKSMNNLGLFYRNHERPEDAEPLFVECLELKQRVLGSDHPGTLRSRNNLAVLYVIQGRYEEAERQFQEVLVAQPVNLDHDHPDRLSAMGNLIDLYLRQNRTDDARPMVRKLLQLRRARAEAGPTDAAARNEYARLALTCRPPDLREPHAALPFALEANELTDFSNWRYLGTLAMAQAETGDVAAAIATQNRALGLIPTDANDTRAEFEQRLREFEQAPR